jgi:hypothetical protein
LFFIPKGIKKIYVCNRTYMCNNHSHLAPPASQVESDHPARCSTIYTPTAINLVGQLETSSALLRRTPALPIDRNAHSPGHPIGKHIRPLKLLLLKLLLLKLLRRSAKHPGLLPWLGRVDVAAA